MNLIPILLLLTLNAVHGFDGRIEYDIDDTRNNIDGKQVMKLGIKKNLMYFDMGKIVNNEFSSSMKVITDFKTKTLSVVVKKNVRKRKFDKPLNDPGFIMPEETLTLRTKKRIIGIDTEEFETFYISNKARLPVKQWFASSLDMPLYQPVWQVRSFNEELGFLNLLFNPTNKKIALELTINRTEKTKKIYSAKKIERTEIDDSEFETFSGEGYLYYEGFNSKDPKTKLYLTMALKSDVIRFNTSYTSNISKAVVRSLVLDYNQRIFISRDKKQLDTGKMQSELAIKDFTPPGEVISTTKKKSIAGMPAEEFETSYLYNGKKVLINMWYTPKLYLYYYTPVLSLYNIDSVLGMYNLFVHPQTKQVALEIIFRKANGSWTTFKCVKWEKKSIPFDFFNMGGKTFQPL